MGRLTHRTRPGCSYFITTDAWQKRSLFHVVAAAEIVCARIRFCRDQGAYLLHEFVLMPDHLHLLLTPSESTTLEKAMQLIKGGSSHEIRKERGNRIEIWQPGFHDWTIRNEDDFRAKQEYIRLNPVHAKLVERPEQWHFGSASGKFEMDPMPEHLSASGAKAPQTGRAANVGAKAPTP
jgi:putative transposase